MSSQMEKDSFFLKHLFAQQSFNSDVYSLRRLFSHSAAAAEKQEPPQQIYTLRRLFKESITCHKTKEQIQADMDRFYLDRLFCEKRKHFTNQVYNLKSFFQSFYNYNGIEYHYPDHPVYNLQDLFQESPSAIKATDGKCENKPPKDVKRKGIEDDDFTSSQETKCIEADIIKLSEPCSSEATAVMAEKISLNVVTSKAIIRGNTTSDKDGFSNISDYKDSGTNTVQKQQDREVKAMEDAEHFTDPGALIVNITDTTGSSNSATGSGGFTSTALIIPTGQDQGTHAMKDAVSLDEITIKIVECGDHLEFQDDPKSDTGQLAKAEFNDLIMPSSMAIAYDHDRNSYIATSNDPVLLEIFGEPIDMEIASPFPSPSQSKNLFTTITTDSDPNTPSWEFEFFEISLDDDNDDVTSSMTSRPRGLAVRKTVNRVRAWIAKKFRKFSCISSQSTQ